MKRSKQLKLVVMGLSPFVLSACGERPVDALIYETVEQCAGDKYYDLSRCQAEHDKALSNHAKYAPRYKSRYDCEYDFGSHACDSSGAQYTPKMSAFMMPMPVGSSRYGSVVSQPLYTSRDDFSRYRTTTNSTVGTVGQVGKTATTASKASTPKVRTTTVSRGGFGSQAAARGGWGSS